jgi:hypothetical protein
VDGHAFDRMARLWGTSTHRRRALQLIGAGVLSGSWLGRGSKIAAAQTSVEQMTCTQEADCQDGESDPCTGASCQEGFCTYFIVSCIPGTTCCGNGECCAAGGSGGCMADADCVQINGDPCWGTQCVSGVCVARHVECPAGEFCRNGTCVPFGHVPNSVS